MGLSLPWVLWSITIGHDLCEYIRSYASGIVTEKFGPYKTPTQSFQNLLSQASISSLLSFISWYVKVICTNSLHFLTLCLCTFKRGQLLLFHPQHLCANLPRYFCNVSYYLIFFILFNLLLPFILLFRMNYLLILTHSFLALLTFFFCFFPPLNINIIQNTYLFSVLLNSIVSMITLIVWLLNISWKDSNNFQKLVV